MPTICSGVYFENDVLVFPNGYAVRNKLRQNLVDKPGKSDISEYREKRNRVELQFCLHTVF